MQNVSTTRLTHPKGPHKPQRTQRVANTAGFSLRSLWPGVRLCLALIALSLLAGCGEDFADPATLAASLKPENVFAQLSTTNTVPKAADQFASALNIDPQVVRIRLKPGDCTLCSLEARPQVASMAGISVVEAEKLLEINDDVSFFIPNFSCTFLYDGETLTPRTCQMSPI
jgi:hypothetical protein